MRQPVPVAADTLAFSRVYPGRVDQMQVIRADLRKLLGDCAISDEIILCVSELAANAALHSLSCLPGAGFIVRAEIRPGDHAWIEVADNGGSWTESAPDASRDHGLDIIRALASTWGINGDDAGRVIWTRLDWPSG